MKVKTIIVEDEKLARDLLKNYISRNSKLEFIDEFSNPFDALLFLKNNKVDLIFLDIQMPKLNGFEFLELLESKPKVVFTTAYEEYAIKAFEVNAIDYLLKPFSMKRFNDAVEKVLKSNVDYEKFELNRKLERVVVNKKDKIVIVPVNEIKYIKAEDDYISIFTEKDHYLKNFTMKKFEKKLPGNEFVRIHRSYIINLSFLESFNLKANQSNDVKLKGGEILPVSRTGAKLLKEILMI